MRRALGVERFHLSGTSWGGALALEYAARKPQGLYARMDDGADGIRRSLKLVDELDRFERE